MKCLETFPEGRAEFLESRKLDGRGERSLLVVLEVLRRKQPRTVQDDGIDQMAERCHQIRSQGRVTGPMFVQNAQRGCEPMHPQKVSGPIVKSGEPDVQQDVERIIGPWSAATGKLETMMSPRPPST